MGGTTEAQGGQGTSQGHTGRNGRRGDSSAAPCPLQLPSSVVHRQRFGPYAAHFLHCPLRSCDGLDSFSKASPQASRRLALPRAWLWLSSCWSVGSGLLWCTGVQLPRGPKGQRKEAGSELVASRLLPSTSSFLPGPFLPCQPLTRSTTAFILEPTLLPLVRERTSPVLDFGHSPRYKERPRDRKGDLPSGRARTKNLGSRYPTQGHFL